MRRSTPGAPLLLLLLVVLSISTSSMAFAFHRLSMTRMPRALTARVMGGRRGRVWLLCQSVGPRLP